MVKPRENRVPIMLSDNELQAIDEWRFENRIATRSEAVRRLCQIAIPASEAVPEIASRADVLDADARLLLAFTFKIAGTNTDAVSNELLGRIKHLVDHVSDVYLLLQRENNRIIPLSERRGIHKASQEAGRIDSVFSRLIHAINEDEPTYLASRQMTEIWEEMSEDERDEFAGESTRSAMQQDMFWRGKLAEKRSKLPGYRDEGEDQQ